MAERAERCGRGHGDVRDGGFTLIEALVASVILLVAGTAVVIALISTGNWYASANARSQASALASQQLASVRTRDYADIEVDPTTTHTSQGSLDIGPSIPATQSVVTSGGVFTVVTSVSSTVDTATQIPMKLIQVSVSTPVLASPVTMWGYATETTGSPTGQFAVPVTVNCVTEEGPDSSDWNLTTDWSRQVASDDNTGTPVELLDINDPSLQTVDYWALTNGNNAASFTGVMPGQYWLTVAPSYPVVHAYHFPQRVIVAAGSSNTFYLGVTAPDPSGSTQASLRVGAYTADGCTLDGNGNLVPTLPYDPVTGLTVYAQPHFNETYPGYPDLSLYPTSTPTYSGSVNAYGVAVIHIPWTLDPSAAAAGLESWTISAATSSWSQSRSWNGSGSWLPVTGDLLTVPETPSQPLQSLIPQFTYVTGTPQ